MNGVNFGSTFWPIHYMLKMQVQLKSLKSTFIQFITAQPRMQSASPFQMCFNVIVSFSFLLLVFYLLAVCFGLRILFNCQVYCCIFCTRNKNDRLIGMHVQFVAVLSLMSAATSSPMLSKKITFQECTLQRIIQPSVKWTHTNTCSVCMYTAPQGSLQEHVCHTYTSTAHYDNSLVLK